MDPILFTTMLLSDANVKNKVYDDTFQPAMKNIGQVANTLTSTLKVMLAPISWAVYGFDLIDEKVKSKLEEKFRNTPLNQITEPEANIVIPAYEALRYSLDKETLKEMYINLIASSMTEQKKSLVHPAFVEVIKQLSSFDAEFLKLLFEDGTIQIPKIKLRLQKSETDTCGVDAFKSILSSKYYTNPSLINDYVFTLDNLERLKIIETLHDYALNPVTIYDEVLNNINLDGFTEARPDTPYPRIIMGSITLTNFGKQFISSVIN